MSATTTFVATALVIAFPWIYSLRRSSLSWQTVVSLLLLAHSLAGLHTLLLRSPPNVFKALRVPLNTPTDAIRALLLQKSDTPEIGSELDELLRRLASLETRSLYPRFGHNVIATCSYCYSFQDFALYFLPRPVMSYLREVAFIGLITIHRRKTAVTILFLMFVLEMYIIFTAEIKILPSDRSQLPFTIWWHDVALLIRRVSFLLLPLAVHNVPKIRIPFISGSSPSSTVNTSALLVQTHKTLVHLLPALHLLKYGQAATMRVPELRERAASWWEEEARVGTWIRQDGADDPDTRLSVRGVARGLGTSFDEAGEGVEEGKLRTSAKVMTKVLMIDGVKPSPHWQPRQEKKIYRRNYAPESPHENGKRFLLSTY